MIRSVYIIGISDNPVKVGVADDVGCRLASLQVGCPEELRVFASFPYPWTVAAHVEAGAHQMLRQSHRRGEWFNVTSQEAAKAVERVSDGVMARWRTGGFGRTDSLLRLITDHDVTPWVFDVLHTYREAKAGNPKAHQAMNRAIVDAEGAAVLTTFQMFAAKGTALDTALARAPGTVHKALAATAKAINALAEYQRGQAEENLLDEILRNVA